MTPRAPYKASQARKKCQAPRGPEGPKAPRPLRLLRPLRDYYILHGSDTGCSLEAIVI